MTEAEGPRSRLEEAILGEVPELTSEDVASGAGVTLEEARRLWRALGFPDARDEVAFTDGDLRALSLLMSAVDSGAVDFDVAVQLTRAVGQTMARLADWQIATLVGRVEEMMTAEDAPESRADAALRLIHDVGVPFETLMIYAWRRHLAVAVSRAESQGARAEDLRAVQVTVGFADLVNFTAASNELGQDQIGDLVERFEARAQDLVAGFRGRVIKTLGDSVLFVAERATQGVEIGLAIVEDIGDDPTLPDVRVGLASGNVVLRLGDVFGPPVNLAARLTSVARRNRVIIDPETAALLPADRYVTRSLPGRPVRGFGLVEPVAVRRAQG